MTSDIEKGAPETQNEARTEVFHHREIEEAPPRDSSSTEATRNPEDEIEEARRNNPLGLTKTKSGVSVEQARDDFRQLSRELSNFSRVSRVSRPSRDAHHKGGRSNSKSEAQEDVIESGATSSSISEEDQFDLEAALRTGLDAEQQAGIRPKHIGVYWDDFTVKGMGGASNYVKTFPNAFIDFFDVFTPIRNMLGMGKKGTEVTLLDNFRGVCQPGEMVLVLGRPGSGCTTFLKSIANQRFGYTSVTGDVMYGPYTAEEFNEFRGEAVYNAEDDLHHATLTVEQTLGFALDTKTPKKLPAGLTKAQYKKFVIDMLLKMFNIEHTRHTVVGGPFVRGVSGGERKRVSISEMLITNVSLSVPSLLPTQSLTPSQNFWHLLSVIFHRILSG